MRNLLICLLPIVLLTLLTGCRHPMTHLRNINLGMTPADVEAEMGKPYAVRSAKLMEGEETTMVWEYWPPYFSNNTSKVHVIFENGRVVQWGVPGDYGTGSEKNVKEYNDKKAR